MLVALALFNHSNNRWGIYSPDRLHFVDDIQVNRFALKTWHILDNPDQYDCLLMGSSRVEMIDSAQLPGRCYNFTHSGGTPRDHRLALEQFARAGVELQRVYIGLDEFSYIQDPDEGETQMMRRPPPATWLEWLTFHATFLLHFPGQRDWEIFNGNEPRVPIDWYVLAPENHLPEMRRKAQANLQEADVHDQRLYRLPATYWSERNNIDSALQDIQQIVALSESMGFELVLFFNPLHYKTYLQQHLDRLERFKRGVVAYAPLLDFTGLTPESLDNRLWYETSHYSTAMGDFMVPYLRGEQLLEPPHGRLLTAATLEQGLALGYQQDITQLLTHDKFRGGQLIPAQLGQLLLSQGSESPLAPPTMTLEGIRQSGQHWIADAPGGSVVLSGFCAPNHLAVYDVALDEPQRSFLYSPGYLGERRQRYFLPAGRQRLHLLVNGLGCDERVRYSPFPARGHLQLLQASHHALSPVAGATAQP